VNSRWNWIIEIRTGDREPHQEWLELSGARGRRFRYLDRDEAEAMLARLARTQPHAEFRVAPLT
jgi:hypothetical protein